MARFDQALSLDAYNKVIVPETYRVLASYIDDELDLDSSSHFDRLLGILQHHGFPSPLLDWTTSPYVAAYFAFCNLAFSEPETDQVTIWRLESDYSIENLKRLDGHSAFEVIRPPSRGNQRMLAQSGVFTRSNSLEPLDEYLASAMKRHPRYSSIFLKRYDISVLESRDVLGDLEQMGIHPGTLFPGLEGACIRLKQKVFMDPSLEKCTPPSVKEFVATMLARHQKSR